jgi:hypothetical protein
MGRIRSMNVRDEKGIRTVHVIMVLKFRPSLPRGFSLIVKGNVEKELFAI